ncbi:tripartite tricarboxylate transporter substrate binding protein [Variovorax sp. EL159]|uniref:Bug family tripartite tricarboxylate transporter substrate binding protein n=1 Tax=Variovorax sp. EL159 TaxID=1566270 RepID=UPI000884F59D|nr:tripartite tricarboxylate transporter substrate binding protein [Variovorax sp. EL159]SCX72543.1 Tripartite-type tricarboxylate transporter, receptor component TctC [Variovorax sp. EL159]
MHRRHLFPAALFTLSLATQGARRALAQAAPPAPNTARTVRLINGFSPGGAVDTLSRAVAERMGTLLGQAVVVDNRPGASGMIAADVVARATPDGLTVGVLDVGALAVNPALQKRMAYDPAKDFAYIGLVARIPLLLVVHPSVQAANLKELTALLRASPGTYAYASAGIGNPLHLAMEAYKQASGVEVVHVPYKGASSAVQDVLGGRVPLMFIDVNTSAQHIRAGTLKPLAIATRERNPTLPGVPTFAESGFPAFEATPWIGLVGPAALPLDTKARLAGALAQVMTQTDTRSKIIELGFVPLQDGPDAFARLANDDRIAYAKLIRERGISLD